jgi:hypothetical protein
MKEIIERIVIPVEIVCNEPGCQCKRVASAYVDSAGYEPIDACNCGHPVASHVVSKEL